MSTRPRSDRGRARVASLLVCAAALSVATAARADDDDLSAYRDRFRMGMEQYKAGEVAAAIGIWRAIYEELGPKRGYRLAFNLARAYDTNGEATRAAERYRAFLDEAGARQTAGEALEPLVEREVRDAQERMTELNRSHGRIEVAAVDVPTLAQVDDADPRLGAFTAYVAPGRHIVTFRPGREDAEKVEITVAAGELVVAHATARERVPVPVPQRLSVDDLTHKVTKHPFSPVVLYTGIVVTAASVVAPAVAYTQALSIYDTAVSTTATPTERQSANTNYTPAKTLAYGMLALPISLAAITGGLTTWYFTGAHEELVSLSFDAAPTPRGAGGALTARF